MENNCRIAWKIVLLLVAIQLCGCITRAPWTPQISLLNQADAKKNFIPSISNGRLGGPHAPTVRDFFQKPGWQFVGVKSIKNTTLFLYKNDSYFFNLLIRIDQGAKITTNKSGINHNYDYYRIIFNDKIRICEFYTEYEPDINESGYNFSFRQGFEGRCSDKYVGIEGEGEIVFNNDEKGGEDFISTLLSIWPEIVYERI